MKDIDINLVKCSGLHDYEIVKIDISYSNAVVILQLNTPAGAPCSLTISNFVIFKIDHLEEWGKGKYVFSSDLEFNHNSKFYDIEIQLNSGDIILIQYKE